MNTFVFMEYYPESGRFNLGLYNDEQPFSKLCVVNEIEALQVKCIIDNISTGCIFVGIKIRENILKPLLHELCKIKVELPEKLKFHWIPPYKLPIDDVDWLFNYGLFSSDEDEMDVYDMAEELGIYDTKSSIDALAKVYFTLVGDFNRIND